MAAGLVLAVGLAGGAYWLTGDDGASEAAVAAGPAEAVPEDVADEREMTVYMSPTCACCGDWVEHMEEHGFEAEVVLQEDLRGVKIDKGVPPDLASCHTAVIGGYVVEGHIPAQDVLRFLEEAPDVAGLAVPGMPIGSPGMEGAYEEEYDVLTFEPGGETQVFASHP